MKCVFFKNYRFHHFLQLTVHRNLRRRTLGVHFGQRERGRHEFFMAADTDCCYCRNMQKLWCVQHKNIKGLQEGLHMGCNIKKYVL